MKLANVDLNPQPKFWPMCSECKAAYVLRRAMCMKRKPDCNAFSLEMSWVWQRDCKHKKAEAVTDQEHKTKRRRK